MSVISQSVKNQRYSVNIRVRILFTLNVFIHADKEIIKQT